MVDGDEGDGLTKHVVKLEELKLDEKYLSKISAIDEVMKRSDAINRAIGNDSALARATAMADRIKLPFKEINERMESIRRATGMDSTLGRLTKQIEEQQKRIKSIDASIPNYDFGRPEKYYTPPVERIKFPPNPILETNERLASIESRFDQMHAVAKEGAEIATGLQAAAAEFLQKFEMAASENDRAASGAIRIGRWAIVIAMAMPIVQVGLLKGCARRSVRCGVVRLTLLIVWERISNPLMAKPPPF
jgi:DNA repair ATPase RecN